jgi:hypothetical protein
MQKHQQEVSAKLTDPLGVPDSPDYPGLASQVESVRPDYPK